MAWPQYLGRNVMDRVAVQSNQPEQSVQSITIGRDFQRRSRFTFARPAMQHHREFLFTSRLDMLDFRAFFRTHSGRLSAFWLPSFARDFVLHAGAVSGSTTISVKPLKVNLLDGRVRHIFIQRINFRARITSITDQTSYFSLALSAALPADILIDDVVCNLHYVRFGSGELTVRHVEAMAWATSVLFEELPMEVPLT